MDRYHAAIEGDLYGTVAWFDRFFEYDLHGPMDNATSTLRVTNDFRWDEDEGFDYRIRVRARIRLPHLKGKWRLTISGENRGDPTATAPEDAGNPGLAVLAKDGRASTELAYEMVRSRNTVLFAGAGVKIRTDPSAFARIRLVHARELGYSVLGQVAVTPYWDTQNGFGEVNELSLERPIGLPTLVRWSGSIGISEESDKEDGWLWGTDLSVLYKISPDSGITVGVGASGWTRPSAVVGNYRAFARYRRNFLRSWLYYELEPDVNWTRQDDGSRKTILGGTVRLEVSFYGKAPTPTPPPATSPAAP